MTSSRSRRSVAAPSRPATLEDAVADYLRREHLATVVQIARALRRRDESIRGVLQSPRFVTIDAPPGRRSNAEYYELAPMPVPRRGTGWDRNQGTLWNDDPNGDS